MLFLTLSALAALPSGELGLADNVQTDASKSVLAELEALAKDGSHDFDTTATCESGARAVVRLIDLTVEAESSFTPASEGVVVDGNAHGSATWRVDTCESRTHITETLTAQTEQRQRVPSMAEAEKVAAGLTQGAIASALAGSFHAVLTQP